MPCSRKGVILTKEVVVVVNIQSYGMDQVVKILVQNFKHKQIVIQASKKKKKKKKKFEKPILLHKYLIKLHKNVTESTGTQIKTYIYSD
ncbi:unnamed protein product [Bubo scandiacus]